MREMLVFSHQTDDVVKEFDYRNVSVLPTAELIKVSVYATNRSRVGETQ